MRKGGGVLLIWRKDSVQEYWILSGKGDTMTVRSCKMCVHYSMDLRPTTPVVKGADDIEGECRFFPPTVFVFPGPTGTPIRVSCYPPVKPFQPCGQFECRPC
jgi:hypothetical protein